MNKGVFFFGRVLESRYTFPKKTTKFLMNSDLLHSAILKLPLGYSEGRYLGKRYGLTRTDFNGGRSIKVYAEALGDIDFISFNYYRTQAENLLKPCEMPKTLVIRFLMGFVVISDS